MEKLTILLLGFGFCLVHCCDNFRYDDFVYLNNSAKCIEASSEPRGSEKQVVEFFNDFTFAVIRMFSSVPKNSECGNHVDGVIQQAKMLNLWALKLLDASAKLPSGILSGNLNQFGDFDECLSSKGYYKNQYIKGKYCLANMAIKIDKSNDTSNKLQSLDAAIHSNWILHNEFRDEGHRIPKFETFNVGVCVPASCGAEEVEHAFNEHLNKISNGNLISFQVSVSEEVCYTEQEKTFPLIGTIVRFLFLLIIGLTVLGTLTDLNKLEIKTDQMKRILLCFSLKKNLNSLLKTASVQDDIKCIHGARFLNALALLLSHKQIAMLFTPTLNRTQMSDSVSKSWTMIGRSAILYTDSFILFSGLLVSYSIVKDLDNKKVVNFKDKLINRLLRLIPDLVGVILFCTYVMEDMGSGPQWGLVVSKYANLCKKYMWRNLLFIHNYFGFENMCLTHTHQLGIDMQLFLMSPVFVYLLWNMPKLGTLFLTLVASFSTWMRYSITLKENLSTLLYYGISVERLWKTANMSYILPTHRLTVYLTGILLGFYLRRGGQTLRFSFSQATIGWILAITSGTVAVFGPYWAAFKEYEYNVNDAARFNAFAPILWMVFLSWTLLACLNGRGGFFNEFLSWKYFTIFTRISYAIYLTQFPVFFYNVGSEKTSQYYKGFHSLFDIEELGVILIASILLTLTIDIPCQELKKAFLSSSANLSIDKSNKPADEDGNISRKENRRHRKRKILRSFGT